MSTPTGEGPQPGGTPTGPIAPRDSEQPGDEPPLLETERVPPASTVRSRRFGAVPVAWTVAISADAVQWILAPLFWAGAASPVDDIVDVVVAAILVKTLGWHWAFAPSFVVKLIPVADFVPTWTMAVWIATRGRKTV